MMRRTIWGAILICTGCGGKAVDGPVPEGLLDPGGETPGSGDGDLPSLRAEARVSALCESVCDAWGACASGEEVNACKSDCVSGYPSAVEVGCGAEYEALLECTDLANDSCSIVHNACEPQAEVYFLCIT